MSVLGGRAPLTAEGTASSGQALGEAWEPRVGSRSPRAASHAPPHALFVWQSITRPFKIFYRPEEKRQTMTVYKRLDVSGGSIVWRLVYYPSTLSAPFPLTLANQSRAALYSGGSGTTESCNPLHHENNITWSVTMPDIALTPRVEPMDTTS